MRVFVDDQGAIERFVGREWAEAPERARGRWREAQRIVDVLASEIELLAIEVLVGPRDAVRDEVIEREVHLLVVPDAPPGVRVAARSAGPKVSHAPLRIDGAALEALLVDETVEWSSVRVLAAFAPTLDAALVIDRASDVRPFERRGVLGIAGPLEIPGLGLHAPLDVTITDDWGRTLVTFERAWSSWVEKGPDLDRYLRIVGKLAALDLEPEPRDDGAVSTGSAAPSTAVAARSSDAFEATVASTAASIAVSESAPAPAKPEYVFVASKRAGPCVECRHANHGTVEFFDGQVFCGRTPLPRTRDSICDVTVPLPRYRGEPHQTWGRYFLFERYDGANAVQAGAFNADVRAEDREPDDGA